mmetsp:Transcript_43305/g.109393  ORF Transcript_43305/g.109393 Transcript_43305/m.109393 type:complete len:213 (-) Transcript_43305:123-761(-)
MTKRAAEVAAQRDAMMAELLVHQARDLLAQRAQTEAQLVRAANEAATQVKQDSATWQPLRTPSTQALQVRQRRVDGVAKLHNHLEKTLPQLATQDTSNQSTQHYHAVSILDEELTASSNARRYDTSTDGQSASDALSSVALAYVDELSSERKLADNSGTCACARRCCAGCCPGNRKLCLLLLLLLLALLGYLWVLGMGYQSERIGFFQHRSE